MNYLQIRAFHLVALEGSVRRAAEVMGVSQPTVTQHLKGLEERHGVRLFDKRGRGPGHGRGRQHRHAPVH